MHLKEVFEFRMIRRMFLICVFLYKLTYNTAETKGLSLYLFGKQTNSRADKQIAPSLNCLYLLIFRYNVFFDTLIVVLLI